MKNCFYPRITLTFVGFVSGILLIAIATNIRQGKHRHTMMKINTDCNKYIYPNIRKINKSIIKDVSKKNDFFLKIIFTDFAIVVVEKVYEIAKDE